MLPRSSSDFWEHLDKLHVEREERRGILDTPKNEAGGTFGEREGGRGAPIICTVKRELEVSPVRLSEERGERGREREIKVAEWRFLLREFGELVKRVILFDAATATATDSRISRYRRPPTSVIHNRTKGVVSNGSSFLRQ